MKKKKFKESRFDKGWVRETKASELLIRAFKDANPQKEGETLEQYYARYLNYKLDLK